MKINRFVIFSLVVIVLIVLGSIESRNEKKTTKKAKKALNKKASRLARMVSEFPMTKDVNAWKRDKFMSHLKDEPKYKKTANTTNKWTLFNYLIGKTLTYLGIQDAEAAKYVKTLTQPRALKIVILLMQFQKSMDFATLAPPMLALKIPGLTSANFMPLGRQKVMNFLNAHVRVRPAWGR